jgi:hypothetical protein
VGIRRGDRRPDHGARNLLQAHLGPNIAPVYALAEGLFLGGVSASFEPQYPGIVIQAVGGTFGTLAGRLDAIREGERTLLDNTLLLHTSSMLHGQHENSRLPAILLGGAGAGVRGGRVLDYTDKPDRQMCRLLMSLMDKMGDRQTAFGDAKAMLDEV